MTNKSKKLIKKISEWATENETIVTFIGTDKDNYKYAPAIVGIATYPTDSVVYDYNKLIKCIMKINGGGYGKAVEWYSYNTERAMRYIPKGENPPIVIIPVEDLINP